MNPSQVPSAVTNKKIVLMPGVRKVIPVFVVNGANGCGKTTLMKGAKLLKVTTITTSDLLRQAIVDGDKDAAVIDHYMNVLKDNVKPCSIAVRLVVAKLKEILLDPDQDVSMVFLDGIGRSARQMRLLASALKKLQAELNVLGMNIDLDVQALMMQMLEDEVERRVMQRRAKAQADGEEPRSEDADGVWQRRAQKWYRQEASIKKAAEACFGQVRISNMALMTSAHLAASLYCEIHTEATHHELEAMIAKELNLPLSHVA